MSALAPLVICAYGMLCYGVGLWLGSLWKRPVLIHVVETRDVDFSDPAQAQALADTLTRINGRPTVGSRS